MLLTGFCLESEVTSGAGEPARSGQDPGPSARPAGDPYESCPAGEFRWLMRLSAQIPHSGKAVAVAVTGAFASRKQLSRI